MHLNNKTKIKVKITIYILIPKELELKLKFYVTIPILVSKLEKELRLIEFIRVWNLAKHFYRKEFLLFDSKN